MNTRNKVLVVLTVLIFCAVGYYAFMETNSHSTATYQPDGYYKPAKSNSQQSNKSYYNSLQYTYQNTCITQPVKASKTTTINSLNWLKEISTTQEDIDWPETDDGYYKLYDDDERIVAPAEFTYKDCKNITHGTETGNCTISGTIKVGSTVYYLEFRNCKAWWCHMNKTNDMSSHTIKIGDGCEFQSISSGSVLGVATKDTTLYLQKMKEDGILVPATLQEMYNQK